MPRFKASFVATLTIEIDAPSPEAARGCLYHHFEEKLGVDPLQGTRFTLASTERQCSNPVLMTTVIGETMMQLGIMDEIEVEEI